MRVRLLLHPSDLTALDLSRNSVVVFDVLRATTTMVTALANGATDVRAFAELDDARRAHAAFAGHKVLAGERGCLPPPGFDVGNSPVAFTPERVSGATVFLSTTNGTRAVRACERARHTLVASLVNASATARHLVALGEDVVLVCAGVDGAPGGEDIDGAATVADAMGRLGVSLQVDDGLDAIIAQRSALNVNLDVMVQRLLAAPGGVNLARAGLQEDVVACAQVDRFDAVAIVQHRADHARIATAAS